MALFQALIVRWSHLHNDPPNGGPCGRFYSNRRSPIRATRFQFSYRLPPQRLRQRNRLLPSRCLHRGQAVRSRQTLIGAPTSASAALTAFSTVFFTVDHKGLGQQYDFFEELAHPAFDHFLDDFLRLAGVTGLLDQDGTLAFDNVCIKLVGRDCQRAGRSDVHGNLFAESRKLVSVTGRFQTDQNTDLAHTRDHLVMDVRRDDAPRLRKRPGRGADACSRRWYRPFPRRSR